jgi:hypothetical protein
MSNKAKTRKGHAPRNMDELREAVGHIKPGTDPVDLAMDTALKTADLLAGWVDEKGLLDEFASDLYDLYCERNPFVASIIPDSSAVLDHVKQDLHVLGHMAEGSDKATWNRVNREEEAEPVANASEILAQVLGNAFGNLGIPAHGFVVSSDGTVAEMGKQRHANPGEALANLLGFVPDKEESDGGYDDEGRGHTRA